LFQVIYKIKIRFLLTTVEGFQRPSCFEIDSFRCFSMWKDLFISFSERVDFGSELGYHIELQLHTHEVDTISTCNRDVYAWVKIISMQLNSRHIKQIYSFFSWKIQCNSNNIITTVYVKILKNMCMWMSVHVPSMK
jgi:hypothetical protein